MKRFIFLRKMSLFHETILFHEAFILFISRNLLFIFHEKCLYFMKQFLRNVLFIFYFMKPFIYFFMKRFIFREKCLYFTKRFILYFYETIYFVEIS